MGSLNRPATQHVSLTSNQKRNFDLKLQHRPFLGFTIESRFHDVDIRQVKDGYQVSIINPYALADRDFELNWTPALQTTPSTSLTTYNDGEAVYVQLMLAPPIKDAIEIQPR